MTRRIEGIEEEKLRYLYNDENMSLREIGKYYGVNVSVIQRRFREYKIKSKTLSEAIRKYSINEDFFKTWTSESAWMYGWVIGDGNYKNPWYLGFEVSEGDKEILENFRRVLDSQHKIIDLVRWNKKYQKYYCSSKIVFQSKELVKDLNLLSISDIPIDIFSHALRGFFEAEGTIYWHKNKNLRKGGSIVSAITQNDMELLRFLLDFLDKFGITEGGKIYQYKKSAQLTFSASDSIALYHYLYDNCGDLFLKRKKVIFEELMKRQLGGLS